jgi:hypothetical protein
MLEQPRDRCLANPAAAYSESLPPAWLFRHNSVGKIPSHPMSCEKEAKRLIDKRMLVDGKGCVEGNFGI